MAEENALRLEKLEKSHQKMKENIMEMMEMIKGKNSAENTNPPNVAILQEAKKEEPTLPLVYAHPQAQTSQRTYPTMMPQSRGFSFTYPVAPMVQVPKAGQ